MGLRGEDNPTAAQVWFGTAIIMLGVAFLSLGLHALLDPIHQAMGVHEARLQRFLNALEARLLENVRTNMAARIFATRSSETQHNNPSVS